MKYGHNAACAIEEQNNLKVSTVGSVATPDLRSALKTKPLVGLYIDPLARSLLTRRAKVWF